MVFTYYISILVQEVSSDFGHHIDIDIIGVEKEVELIPVFKVRFNLYILLCYCSRILGNRNCEIKFNKIMKHARI